MEFTITVRIPEEHQQAFDSLLAGISQLSKLTEQQEKNSDGVQLPERLTRKQVATYLGCTLSTVDNYHSRGWLHKIPDERNPRFVRIPREQVLKLKKQLDDPTRLVQPVDL